MTKFISNCDSKGIPKDKPITCTICGFVSQSEGSHRSHKGNAHHKDSDNSYHVKDNYCKSGKYSYES